MLLSAAKEVLLKQTALNNMHTINCFIISSSQQIHDTPF